jgi:aromatic-L-amino-acid decarboxylase
MMNNLEPNEEEIRDILSQATDHIIEFLSNNQQPAKFNLQQASLEAQQLGESLPEQQQPLENILKEFFNSRVTNALPTSHPGFMAYIPGGGIIHTAVADLIAKITNRYIGIEVTAPFLSQIETNVLQWFCEMIGYSEKSGGTLTSGGSIANLTGVICARTLIMGDDFSKGTVYASGYVHHSMWKAFQAAGIAASQIRNIPVDENFKLDINALQQTIKNDQRQGLTPFMIVATAGSTNTGSVDDLSSIAAIAKKVGAWFHVDAAYGGFFALTAAGKSKLSGIEIADSITLDPHKGLFLPYGTGAFIVKDREKLKSVFSHKADYIPDKTEQQSLWDFSEMSLELTRPFRGLGIWLPFKMLGADVFRQALNEKLELAEYFHQSLMHHKQWKIIANPELSLTVFKFHNDDLTAESIDEINRDTVDWVNQKGRVNISGTIIDGHFVIRNCILSFRTHRQHVDFLIQDLNLGLQQAIHKHNQ